MKKNILQKDYSINGSNYQLKLPLNLEYIIPENDSVRLLSQCVEEMDLTDLYSTYKVIKENQVQPRQLFKIVMYGYMNHKYSSRSIELACKRDINFMYLLEGMKAPDHSTIARFRNEHLSQCCEKLMTELSELLYEVGEISGESIFIDGTKIEACANKYTFVWKKAVTKNMEKLFEKIAVFVGKCEKEYKTKIVYKQQVKIKHLKKLRKKLYAIKEIESIKFVKGKSKRKSKLQKDIEILEGYIKKLKEYTQKIHICGNRNSYSKTDHDATFMRMKEDAMLNGQLKPGYNLQHGVDSEYITWLTIGSQPTDTITLIPFLKDMESHLTFKYNKIVADSGYESEENYVFINDNEQIAFIKPSNYEQSKTRKYKNDISRIENMKYNADEDYYICANNKKLVVSDIKYRKSKTGYKSEKTVYRCEDCSNCAYKEKCIITKSKTPLEERTKQVEVAKKFNELRKEDLKRITSKEGCQLRMNRSIQVEGSFGNIKQDMNFRRYMSRGKKNVKTESVLLAMAYNINKLHNKIQSERTAMHLFKSKEVA